MDGPSVLHRFGRVEQHSVEHAVCSDLTTPQHYLDAGRGKQQRVALITGLPAGGRGLSPKSNGGGRTHRCAGSAFCCRSLESPSCTVYCANADSHLLCDFGQLMPWARRQAIFAPSTASLGRPSRRPLARALRSPARTRSAVRLRSNSATGPRTVKTILPVGVEVSLCSLRLTNAMPIELKREAARLRK